ncbi:hypothetical protein [Phenylobacterium sp.]|uniref:hypothetical protein n=1 Tax=Phenylobacterium sp. TaxID=1871053 RepID=UPI00271968E6|nr:hypothetical protein [Phenylobacterium sp.]MDO8800072.1 hypothetical protein [Phenylobacterium sp.]
MNVHAPIVAASTLERFHLIEDGVVILRSKGVYRQAKVYHRGSDVFATWGAGLIKLGPRSDTTHMNVSWDGVEADGVVCDRVGGQPRYVGAGQ